MFDGKVGIVSDSIYHLRRGEVYTINGSTIFVMGGALSIDKDHRTIDVSWWADEIPSYEEMDYGISNLEKCNWEVDYVITHTMPRELLGCFGFGMGLGYKSVDSCAVTGYLDHIARNLKFKDWYFGHFHDDIDRGKYHLLYDRIIKLKKKGDINESKEL